MLLAFAPLKTRLLGKLGLGALHILKVESFFLDFSYLTAASPKC